MEEKINKLQEKTNKFLRLEKYRDKKIYSTDLDFNLEDAKIIQELIKENKELKNIINEIMVNKER